MITPRLERRVGSRASINQILDQMQVTADHEYAGDLNNNALAVFNDLSTNDKRTFLRQSLMLHWERQIDQARHRLDNIVIDQDLQIDPVEVEKERFSIEELNQIELIKMKTWLNKFLLSAGVVSFMVMVLIAYASDTLTDKTEEYLEILTDVVKLIF